MTAAAKACRSIRTYAPEDITHATGLIEDGDCESLAVSVQDTLAALNSLEIVLQDTRDAKRRREARMENSSSATRPGRGTPCWPSRRT